MSEEEVRRLIAEALAEFVREVTHNAVANGREEIAIIDLQLAADEEYGR